MICAPPTIVNAAVRGITNISTIDNNHATVINNSKENEYDSTRRTQTITATLSTTTMTTATKTTGTTKRKQ